MNMTNPYAQFGLQDYAVFAVETERFSFLRKTYLLLAALIVSLISVLSIIVSTFSSERVAKVASHLGYGSWLTIFGVLIAVNVIARSCGRLSKSSMWLYFGLAIVVAVSALTMLPLFGKLAEIKPELPRNIAVFSVLFFSGMVALPFVTHREFFWFGGYTFLAGAAIFSFFLVSEIVGGGLGLSVWLPIAIALLAVGYVLFDTSNILHFYRTDQCLAAALTLFTSASILFWSAMALLLPFIES